MYECPKCGSTETIEISGWTLMFALWFGASCCAFIGFFILVTIPIAIGLFLVSLAMPFAGKLVQCTKCKHIWRRPKQVSRG